MKSNRIMKKQGAMMLNKSSLDQQKENLSMIYNH